jgi:hypothetical protein
MIKAITTIAAMMMPMIRPQLVPAGSDGVGVGEVVGVVVVTGGVVEVAGGVVVAGDCTVMLTVAVTGGTSGV